MIFCSFINGIHPSTHVFTHMFPPCSSYDRLCGAVATFCIPTGSAGSRRTPPTRGGAVECPKGPLLLHAPVLSTLCPATRKLSLKHRGDHGLPAHSVSGAPPAPVLRQVPWIVPWELSPTLPPGLGVSGPPSHPVSGSQPPPSTAVLRMDSGLTHRAQPRPFRLCLSLSTSASSSLSPGLGDFVGALPAFPSVANSLLRVPASPVSSALLPGSAAAAGREEGRTSVSRAGL